MTVNERIAALREAMKPHQLDAYIIPSSDPHQSEYVADHWKSREWISGFTGSAGVVVVTHDHAGLWTDSRYFLQGEQELEGSEMELHKQLNQFAPEHLEWLKENLDKGATVGFDGKVMSVSAHNAVQKNLAPNNIEVETRYDLIQKIWKDRPGLPTDPIFEYDEAFAGQTRQEKLEAIREAMREKAADYHLISTLDDIAWTFNIRGTDVDYNPVAIAFAVVGLQKAWLFVDASKVSFDLRARLEGEGVTLKGYDELESFLAAIPDSKSILLDKGTTNVRVYNALDGAEIISGDTIPLHLKAVKNQVEVSHIKKAMIKDGVALTRLFRWLYDTIKERPVPETEVAQQLSEFRRQQGGYHGESFSAIVGYKGNGAIIHYRPEEDKCANIEADGILLLDSGGQYDEGTTDITRTVALGRPTEEQKRNYTLVLKGHIALATMVFPENTRGVQLDGFARQYLWKHRLNYGHGTGHGVGCFLNVHEPPQGFTAGLSSRGTTVHKPGMFSSNEPGFYKEGEYGIRIENLVLVVEDESNDFGNFLKFDTLTLFPIEQKLIETELLTPEEKYWLNAYHREVVEVLSPHLEFEEKMWLQRECREIE